MAPSATPPSPPSNRIGPHPSYIETAKPYLLQSRIDTSLTTLPMPPAKEDFARLSGITYLDTVRRALSLPIRTFNTAALYYHKFRLLHADNEYAWADASAAALFTACKIEDTLKKSREILCAAWNLKVAAGEGLSSDDARFEAGAKVVIGLERLMLESAGFDFRGRYPQKVMVKLARRCGGRERGRKAWGASVDVYRTWAPLKQSSGTLGIACLELAARLEGGDAEALVDKGVCRYARWATSRGEVMETLLDLLDLYTHHRASTTIGPLHPLETFINIRITLNAEASRLSLPRYTLYASESKPSTTTSSSTTSTLPSHPAKLRNGAHTSSSNSPADPGTSESQIGVRGQNGTVRFMLDAARAREEGRVVQGYYRVEEEECEVEVPNERAGEGERRGR